MVPKMMAGDPYVVSYAATYLKKKTVNNFANFIRMYYPWSDRDQTVDVK